MTYTAVHSELQAPSPSSIIELFELELFQEIHGVSEIWRFHAGTNATAGNGNVVWNGNIYTRFPVEASGFEYTGTGQLPRPTLRVSNVLGTVTAILLSTPRGLEGARVTRIRTLARYLDAANFPTRRNTLIDTEAFDSSVWTNTGIRAYGSGSTLNATYAPNGTLTADLLVESTTTGNHGTLFNNIVPTIEQVFSIHAKAGPGTARYLTLTMGGSGAANEHVRFDLATGNYATGTTTTVITAAGVVELDDGWWRCWIRGTPTLLTAVQARFSTQLTPTTITYTGNNTSGIYLWGAQLEQGSALTAYQSVGPSWTGNPYGTPNPAAEFPREVYYIDRKASENPTLVEFELATAFDLAGVRIPKRQALANLCAWQYRSADCGYTGTLPTCEKTLDACRAHFGESAPLPFGAFPGIGSYYT